MILTRPSKSFGALSRQGNMRLPGTRYQEHGWEQVRKLLGQCSLQAFKQADAGPAPLLDWYTDAVAAGLRRAARGARGGVARVDGRVADKGAHGQPVPQLWRRAADL